MIARSSSSRAGSIELHVPAGSWYEQNAGEMLRVADAVAERLEQEFGLSLPRTDCYVVNAEAAEAIQGVPAAAYRRMTIIGFPERHLSEFAGVVAHELAHVLAGCLGPYAPMFKGEGFACYAAWRIEAQRMPCGLPLHYHLVWMQSVGLKPSPEELWHRRDYTPELYDLAWSFAAFVAERFGKERYLGFYRSGRACMRDRVDDTLGVSLAALQKEWYAHALSRVDVSPSQISRMRRYAGSVCSRAAWLGAR
jgi:hypothetical protein